MNPINWRERAREALGAAEENRFFVRFAKQGAQGLFVTDAKDVQDLIRTGFHVRACSARTWFFDPPDEWYTALVGILPVCPLPSTARQAQLLALWKRLERTSVVRRTISDEGRAFLRETARCCFSPGGAQEKAIFSLRARAAVLARTRDTGAFAAAAGLIAVAYRDEAACEMHIDKNCATKKER